MKHQDNFWELLFALFVIIVVFLVAIGHYSSFKKCEEEGGIYAKQFFSAYQCILVKDIVPIKDTK